MEKRRELLKASVAFLLSPKNAHCFFGKNINNQENCIEIFQKNVFPGDLFFTSVDKKPTLYRYYSDKKIEVLHNLFNAVKKGSYIMWGRNYYFQNTISLNELIRTLYYRSFLLLVSPMDWDSIYVVKNKEFSNQLLPAKNKNNPYCSDPHYNNNPTTVFQKIKLDHVLKIELTMLFTSLTHFHSANNGKLVARLPEDVWDLVMSFLFWSSENDKQIKESIKKGNSLL